MYGSTTEVAYLARMWTLDGSWTTATNPTAAQVTTWLTSVSSMVDIALQGAGFVTPVVLAAAVDAIDMLVNGIVADLCHAANSSGRFFTERIVERGLSPMIMVNHQIANWVAEWTTGLTQMGVPRVSVPTSTQNFSIPPRKQL